MSEFFYESKSKRVVRNINKTLEHRLEVYNFDSEYKINKIKNELLKIHGLCNSRFDFINSIEKAIKQNINDISIDDNSNKQEKTVESIIQEATSPFKKLLGYDYLYREMRNLYGKDEAKRLSGLMYDFTYALSDSTNILKNYCWALNASVLLTEGRPFGQLHSSPSKHLDSYLSALTETIHQLSSHLAGAIAIGTLFIDSASLLIKDGYNIYDLQNNDKIKIIENAFQRFIYSVNHISRSSSESPFTNVSIFDKIKLKHLINESIHLFPNPNNIEIYVEFIYELQQIFMNIFEKGNPIQNGLPFRFPVVTINISKDKNNNIVDLDFLDNICNRDIERYNIFTSEGTKIASCCRLISNAEMLDIASQSNSFGGGGSVSLGSHRVLTLNMNRIALLSNKDNYIQDIINSVDDIVKILKAHRELIKRTQKQGLQMFMDLGWISLNRMFSTVGILGYNEISHTLNTDDDFLKQVIIAINDEVVKKSKEYNMPINIEQIPAESMAVRLCNADKLIFSDDKVPFNLYSNQFIPLWQESTIWDRLKIDGMFNQLITGGGIVHAQVRDKVTPSQAKNIIAKAIEYGCEHFALNPVFSKCSNNHIHIGRRKICPECCEPIVDYMTRVVGFFTNISAWNPIRKNWEFKNRQFVELE